MLKPVVHIAMANDSQVFCTLFIQVVGQLSQLIMRERKQGGGGGVLNLKFKRSAGLKHCAQDWHL
jgi:hypothetical protein